MVGIGVGKVVPTILFCQGYQLSLNGIVPYIDEIGACNLVSNLRNTAERAFENRSAQTEVFVPFPNESRTSVLFEPFEVLLTICDDGIVDVIRHLAQGKDLDAIFSGHDAVLGKEDQVVAVSIEQHATIFRPLVAVIQYALDKLPSLHGSQLLEWSQSGAGYEDRKDY